MSTLAPTISNQISYEKPVGAAPSVLESVLGVAASLGGDYLDAKARAAGSMSEADKKNQALSGYYQELDDIANSDMSPAEQARAAERVRRNYLVAYPSYRTDIIEGASQEFGYDPGEGDVERINMDKMQEWMTTTKGIATMQSLGISNLQGGQVTPEHMRQIEAAYMRDTALQAEILTLADDKASDEIKWRKLGTSFYTTASDMANGLVVTATTNPDLLKQPELVLNNLAAAKRSVRDTILAEAQAAGISLEFATSKVEDAIAPLVQLEELYKTQMETPGRLNDALTKAAQLHVTRSLLETVGPHVVADPTAREVFFADFMAAQLQDEESALKYLEGYKKAADSGDFNTFNFAAPTMPGVAQAATGTDPVVNPSKVSEFRERMQEDDEFLARTLGRSAGAIQRIDTTTVEGKQVALNSLAQITTAFEAHEGPIGEDTLRVIFNPTNIQKLKELGPEAHTMLASLISNQIRYNRALIDNNSSMLVDQRIDIKNGQIVVLSRGKFGTTEWGPANPKSKLAQYANRVNFLSHLAQEIPAVKKEVGNTIQWLYRGVDPTPEQVTELGDDFKWEDLEDVQHVSYQGAPNALVGLIDRTEGGGAYDTLYGHSQRSGGQFAGIKVDEMTIAQALQFADPSGAYGQWVASTDENGKIATPMGRYQIVGATLRQAAKEMGLAEDTVFNARTQDAIFHHLAMKRVRGRTGKEARDQLRMEWAGFKNVPDAELDKAIAAFKGMPPPDAASLDRAVGGPNLGIDGAGVRPQTRPSGFMVDANFRDATVDARMRNPSAEGAVTESFDTEGQRQSSRVSAREARAQIIAALRANGMEDYIEKLLKGDKEDA